MLYVHTESGTNAVKNRRAVELTRPQRYALLLFDGQRSTRAVLDATAVVGATKADIAKLLSLKLIAPSAAAAATTTTATTTPPPPPIPAKGLADSTLAPLEEDLDDQERAHRYRTAYPIAVELMSELGVKGFMLNLKVEKARGFEDLVKLMPSLRKAVSKETLLPLRAALEGH
jgi:hypothetical protein